MATKQSTVDYILDQVGENVTARKMFGEYALYAKGKVIALVCDDTLFVKITVEGKKFVGTYYEEDAAYPGAKPSMRIDEDLLDDREWLSDLIRITAEHVPTPKKKAKKKTRSR
ncbi:TfoX/Sxy family protein [bacterium]|nr:TfoX/Sxy family protein [bacterium]